MMPLWTLPARLVGRIHAGAGEAALVDSVAIARLRPAWLGLALAVTAVIAALLPPLLHLLAPMPDEAPADLLRIESAVFTESLPFVIVALVLGLMAPSLGVLLTLAYAATDFGADLFALATFPTSGYLEMVPHPAAPLGFAGVIVGHVATYWLLWLVAVEVPLAARAVARSMSRSEPASVAGVVAGSVAAAAMVYLWTLAAAVLVRAAFAGTWLRTPSVQAVSVLQGNGAFVAIVAFVVAGVGLMAWRAGARAPSGASGRMRAAGSRPVGIAILASASGALMVLIGLGGIIVRPTDLVILLAAVTLARPAASIFHRRVPALTGLLNRVPLVARLGVGFVAVFAVATTAANALYRTTGAAEFTPLVLTVCIGIFILELFLVPSTDRSPPLRRPRLPTAVVGAVLLTAIALAAPQTARADNCSGLQDCFPTPLVTAITAAAVTVAAAYRRFSGPSTDYPPMAPVYPTPPTVPIPVTRRPWRSRNRPDLIRPTEGPRAFDTDVFFTHGCGIRG